jgi:hypothetical protein
VKKKYGIIWGRGMAGKKIFSGGEGGEEVVPFLILLGPYMK